MRRGSLVLSVAFVTACASSPGPAATPEAGGPRYLALGDSFTAGTGSSPPQSFPARLVSRWSCSVGLLDLGVDGYTTDDLVAEELPRVPAFAPDLVTLAIGANDIVHGFTLATYQAHVHQILAALVKDGVKRVVAIPQPDWSLSPVAAEFGPPATLHAAIVAENAALRAETEAIGGVYVDLFPLMEREAMAGMIASDGLHPSAAAYDAWAAELAKQIATPCPAAPP